MENIREWAAQVTDNQKSKYNDSLADELFRQIRTEVLSDEPDYEGCIIALTMLPHQTISAFYEKAYGKLPDASQKSINEALLVWAKTESKSKKNMICSRLAQSIKQRLKNGENIENLLPELQWYMEHLTKPIINDNLKRIWIDRNLTELKQLFLLDMTGWSIEKDLIRRFYLGIFDKLYTLDEKKQLNSMFLEFLEKNHLNNLEDQTETSIQSLPDKHTTEVVIADTEKNGLPKKAEKKQPAPAADISKSAETPIQNMPVAVDSDTNTTERQPIAAEEQSQDDKMKKEQLSEKTKEKQLLPAPAAGKSAEIPIQNRSSTSTVHTNTTVPQPIISQEPSRPDKAESLTVSKNAEPTAQIIREQSELEKDGVRLAELLLAWSKRQVQDAAASKVMLESANRTYQRLEKNFSALRDELFAAKQEISDKLEIIANLERELAAVSKKLEAAEKQAADLDDTVRKLQQMNENTAEQSVSGYKAELAGALKSIVEDASLPEAQSDADILSALLEDLLGVLRFKGISLEEK